MFTVAIQNWIDDVLTVESTEFETLSQAHEYASEQQALNLQSKIFNEANTLLCVLPIDGQEAYA